MKIKIKGTYRKANSHWVVELPCLSVQVEGSNPFKAFKSLEELIHKEIGIESECSFRINDDGRFELNTGKSPELVSYIAKKIHEQALSEEEIGKILSQIKFNGAWRTDEVHRSISIGSIVYRHHFVREAFRGRRFRRKRMRISPCRWSKMYSVRERRG